MQRYLRAYRSDEEQAEGPLKFVASTSNLARDGLIIDVDAWELDNYRKNPVVLWSHNYFSKPPIGRAEVEVDGDELIATITFDAEDPEAAAIERKYRNGFLHAVSVGWDTHEMKVGSGDEPPRVTRAELLDISAVNVPGDADALIERELAAVRSLQQSLQSVRAGAVLSKRNREDLEQAASLINDVLERATSENTNDDDDEERGKNSVDAFQRILTRLETITLPSL